MRNEVHIRLKCRREPGGSRPGLYLDAQRGAYSAEMPLQAHSTCPFWNETSKCPDSLESLLRKTRRLFVVRLVDQSQGLGTEPLTFDKPQLRLLRPVWEEPPSPSHDVG